MTLAVFELNDSDIGHGTSSDDWRESPGFALLDGDSNIITGDSARKRAWLEPQRSFQHYWHQLNLSPLSHHNGSARHHADLAYAQLQQLYRDSGEPDEVILAVPGSFNREQLGVLLGLVKALPFKAVGLVDSAVAAVSQLPPAGPALYLDMQLHQSVLTRLEGAGELHRTDVEPFNEQGLKGLLDNWAHYVSDQFIRQYRYDPLHTANGEQQLYDQLPGWLQELQTAPQTTASLDTKTGNFRLNLLRNELLASSEPRLQRLRQSVEKFRRAGDQLYISHRVAQLPGLVEALGEHRVLPASAVLEGCLSHLQQIRSEQESLSFITGLAVETKAVQQQPAATRHELPTHVLVGHRALALNQQLNLRLGDDGLEVCSREQADLSLSINGTGLQLHRRPGAAVESPETLQPGSIIRLQNQQLQLIQVEQ